METFRTAFLVVVPANMLSSWQTCSHELTVPLSTSKELHATGNPENIASNCRGGMSEGMRASHMPPHVFEIIIRFLGLTENSVMLGNTSASSRGATMLLFRWTLRQEIQLHR